MVIYSAKRAKNWLGILVFGLLCYSPCAFAAGSVFLEDLTTAELRAAIAAGTTTVLVPIGGTEQNGPHMALGKHNVRVKALAGQIAERLGNAVVAPVLAYVPEGSITPPVAHMRLSGTISIPEATFESVLESIAKSFRQHGFRDIVFLGDHGGYQKSAARAADRINKEFAQAGGAHALALSAYYQASQASFSQVLRAKGYSDAEIGSHAGLADTSMMLAIDKSLVRMNLLAEAASGGANAGVYGDPRKSSAELGKLGLRIIVERSVQAIQDAVKQPRP
ncbi:MAG: creatininase family protein [Rhodoferax sp.]|nr:creatininase family protein [Rhodoferax sp.]